MRRGLGHAAWDSWGSSARAGEQVGLKFKGSVLWA